MLTGSSNASPDSSSRGVEHYKTPSGNLNPPPPVAMSFLHVFGLLVIRCLDTILSFFAGVRSLIFGKPPTPLTQSRARIPQHLAVSLVAPSDTKSGGDDKAGMEALIESVLRVVRWSSQLRAQTLSVYDKHGADNFCPCGSCENLI